MLKLVKLMNHIKTTYQMQELQAEQFETLDEALQMMNHETLLRWINVCYRQQQVSLFIKFGQVVNKGIVVR